MTTRTLLVKPTARAIVNMHVSGDKEIYVSALGNDRRVIAMTRPVGPGQRSQDVQDKAVAELFHFITGRRIGWRAWQDGVTLQVASA